MKQYTVELPRRRKVMSSMQTSPIPAWHEAVLTIRNKASDTVPWEAGTCLLGNCLHPSSCAWCSSWLATFFPPMQSASFHVHASIHPSIVLWVPSLANPFHVQGWEGNPIQSNPVHRTEEIVLS